MGMTLDDLDGMSMDEWTGIVAAWNKAQSGEDAEQKLSNTEVDQLAALVGV